MKKLFVYIVLMTTLFTLMDWKPIHYQWWHNGEWPLKDWQTWSAVRMWTARILCPPCAPLAENSYYVVMEIEAGEDEQKGVLKVPYSHNPINPHGDWSFYWGQGEGREWRRVSMLSFYLYWLPNTLVWWLIVGHLFIGGKPLWRRL